MTRLGNERSPAVWGRDEAEQILSDDYLFSPEHLDNALRLDMEMLVAFARQMLYHHPGDHYDTPIIRERRQEAAKAALNLLWALMAEHNVANDQPPPAPAMLALRLRPPAGYTDSAQHINGAAQTGRTSRRLAS